MPTMVDGEVPDATPRPRHCELCTRWVEELTRHHLIPRTRHRNKRAR